MINRICSNVKDAFPDVGEIITKMEFVDEFDSIENNKIVADTFVEAYGRPCPLYHIDRITSIVDVMYDDEEGAVSEYLDKLHDPEPLREYLEIIDRVELVFKAYSEMKKAYPDENETVYRDELINEFSSKPKIGLFQPITFYKIEGVIEIIGQALTRAGQVNTIKNYDEQVYSSKTVRELVLYMIVNK